MTNYEMEQNKAECQGEIPTEVLDELIAIKLARRLSWGELGDRHFEVTGQRVNPRTLREAVLERRSTRFHMNGDTDLWAAAQRSGRVADMFVCMLHCVAAEWKMLRDAKVWASRDGCLDDFPPEHLKRMEELGNQIRGVFLGMFALFGAETVKAIFDQWASTPKPAVRRDSMIDDLIKQSEQSLFGR